MPHAGPTMLATGITWALSPFFMLSTGLFTILVAHIFNGSHISSRLSLCQPWDKRLVVLVVHHFSCHVALIVHLSAVWCYPTESLEHRGFTHPNSWEDKGMCRDKFSLVPQRCCPLSKGNFSCRMASSKTGQHAPVLAKVWRPPHLESKDFLYIWEA